MASPSLTMKSVNVYFWQKMDSRYSNQNIGQIQHCTIQLKQEKQREYKSHSNNIWWWRHERNYNGTSFLDRDTATFIQ